MYNFEKVKEAVGHLRGRLADTDGGFLTDVEVSRQLLRTVVEYAEERLAGVRERPFKVGDRVQEVCDDTEKPVGTVTEMGSLGQYVVLDSGRYANRRIYYYDNEIEPYDEPAVKPKFRLGQKVETLKEIQVRGMVVKAGTVGIVMEITPLRTHEFEVLFSGSLGTYSFGFDADELKEV